MSYIDSEIRIRPSDGPPVATWQRREHAPEIAPTDPIEARDIGRRNLLAMASPINDPERCAARAAAWRALERMIGRRTWLARENRP